MIKVVHKVSPPVAVAEKIILVPRNVATSVPRTVLSFPVVALGSTGKPRVIEALPTERKSVMESAEEAAGQYVLVFTNPPGGDFDTTGALANSTPIAAGSSGEVLTSDGTTVSFQPLSA